MPPSSLANALSAMPDPLPIRPALASKGRGPFNIVVRPPGSKSLTNRALVLAALAKGSSTLRGALVDADDAAHMVKALRELGATIEINATELRVTGVGGTWRPSAPDGSTRLFLGNAGTAVRFLSAATLLSPRAIVIDGDERMRQRPLGELVSALETLGMQAMFESEEECPPVRLSPPVRGLETSATVEFEPTVSSQFISALLLIAPWMPGGMTLRLEGPITSPSYISMTIGLLDRLGAIVRTSEDLRVIRVGSSLTDESGGNVVGVGPSARGLGVEAFDYQVEPDASGATYFWAAAVLVPGAVARIVGLDARSLQGDAQFPELLSRMGATVITGDEPGSEPTIGCRGAGSIAPIMADLSNMPDAAMTVAAVAAFAGGRSILRGLGTLRHKETDRIAALKTELAKIGVVCETDVLGDRDAMTITPPKGGVDCSPSCPRVEFDTYNDHRMAMAMALVGLRRPNVWIRNPGCVAKTYPGFWQDFEGVQGPG